MRITNRKGFTLVEVIVVAGIIAVLAGILVPLIFKEIDESKIARTQADIRSISNAFIVLKKDVGGWPTSATCSPTITMFNTDDANMPTFAGTGWTTTTVNYMSNRLSVDNDACWPSTWKGPYMAIVNNDPWNHSYVLNADAFLSTASPKAPVWIISAGPDGIVQTNATDGALTGDDIGLRLQ